MTTFKTVGRMTLMCGDGTNDVGALKQVFDISLMLLHGTIYSFPSSGARLTQKFES